MPNLPFRATLLAMAVALSACRPSAPPDGPAPAGARPVYEMSQVDLEPVVLNQGEVNGFVRTYYPRLMRDAGVEGTGTVRFVLGSDGVPERATLQTVNTTHPDFGPPAEQVVARMRFSPARRSGAPVRVYVTLPISFRLR